MYNVYIHAGPAELGVLFVGVQVRLQVLTQIKVNPALLEDLVLLSAPPFLDLPTALLLMHAAGNNGWLCGVLK